MTVNDMRPGHGHAQVRDRELRVWDLLLKGLEGVEIARREGVHPSVISRIKRRVERRITAEIDGKASSLKIENKVTLEQLVAGSWDTTIARRDDGGRD